MECNGVKMEFEKFKLSTNKKLKLLETKVEGKTLKEISSKRKTQKKDLCNEEEDSGTSDLPSPKMKASRGGETTYVSEIPTRSHHFKLSSEAVEVPPTSMSFMVPQQYHHFQNQHMATPFHQQLSPSAMVHQTPLSAQLDPRTQQYTSPQYASHGNNLSNPSSSMVHYGGGHSPFMHNQMMIPQQHMPQQQMLQQQHGMQGSKQIFQQQPQHFSGYQQNC